MLGLKSSSRKCGFGVGGKSGTSNWEGHIWLGPQGMPVDLPNITLEKGIPYRSDSISKVTEVWKSVEHSKI